MKKDDFKVGQEVLLVNNIGRESEHKIPGIVKRIGRKYITVSYGKFDGQEVQFDMTNRFKEKCDWNYWKLFLNENEYQIELLRREYLVEILRFHDWNQMETSELYDVLFRIREFKKRKEQ